MPLLPFCPRVWLLGFLGALACCVTLFGDTVAVRQTEGVVHGFLLLRTLDGMTIANGELIQIARGDRVTTQLVFHFKDGSLYDDTTVYSQHGEFRLVSDHIVQKGPTFPQPLDVLVEGDGDVTVRYTSDHGAPRVEMEHLDLPPDLANGLIPTLLKNLPPDVLHKTVSFLATTPKPRLVKVVVTTVAQERFSTGSVERMATHYALRVDIGGVTGFLASLLGKQPPDSHVWILRGEAPAFVKSEQVLYVGGPVWRVELVSPSWLSATASTK